MRKDYYQILGVLRTASPDEIRRAYRQRVTQCHPDLNRGGGCSEEEIRDVNEAYEVLGDAGRRAEYERELEREELSRRYDIRYRRDAGRVPHPFSRSGGSFDQPSPWPHSQSSYGAFHQGMSLLEELLSILQDLEAPSPGFPRRRCSLAEEVFGFLDDFEREWWLARRFYRRY